MVHEETVRDIIESGSTVVGSLLKELLIHRQQMERMETEKEMELEIAKQRNNHTQPLGQPDVQASKPAGAVVGEVGTEDEIREAINDLRERENCDICMTLLDAIEEADRRTQLRALTEYGRLSQAVEMGASEERIKKLLRESDDLADLLEQQVRQQA